MFHGSLNWMPRYCLVDRLELRACFVSAPLHTNSAAKDRRLSNSFFFFLLFNYDLKKDPDRFLWFARVLNFKELNVEKIIAVKDATYAVAQRKPGLPRFESWPLRYRCSALTNTYYFAIVRYPYLTYTLYTLLYLLTFTVTVYVLRALS